MSLIAVFQNEACVIREWLAHYISQGVEHIYLLNDGSTDDFLSEISPFQEYVTLMDVDINKYPRDSGKPGRQPSIYNGMLLERVKEESEWVAVLDLDEFMYAPFHTIKDVVQQLDKEDPNLFQVLVCWRIFGSNSHLKQPTSVIHGFTSRASDNDPIYGKASDCKSIAKTSALSNFWVHWHIGKGNTKTLFRGNRLLALNHYIVGSWEYFENVKMARGDVNNFLKEDARDRQYFEQYDKNSIVDTRLSDMAMTKIEQATSSV